MNDFFKCLGIVVHWQDLCLRMVRQLAAKALAEDFVQFDLEEKILSNLSKERLLEIAPLIFEHKCKPCKRRDQLLEALEEFTKFSALADKLRSSNWWVPTTPGHLGLAPANAPLEREEYTIAEFERFAQDAERIATTLPRFNLHMPELLGIERSRS